MEKEAFSVFRRIKVVISSYRLGPRPAIAHKQPSVPLSSDFLLRRQFVRNRSWKASNQLIEATHTPRLHKLCPKNLFSDFRRSGGCRLPYSAAIPHAPVASKSCPNWFAAPVGLLTCPCGALLMMPIPLLISKPKHAFPDWSLCWKTIQAPSLFPPPSM